jgi:hypothetical protein
MQESNNRMAKPNPEDFVDLDATTHHVERKARTAPEVIQPEAPQWSAPIVGPSPVRVRVVVDSLRGTVTYQSTPAAPLTDHGSTADDVRAPMQAATGVKYAESNQ